MGEGLGVWPPVGLPRRAGRWQRRHSVCLAPAPCALICPWPWYRPPHTPQEVIDVNLSGVFYATQVCATWQRPRVADSGWAAAGGA